LRRLGHFGLDNINMEESLRFYTDLLGLVVSDVLDHNRIARDPKLLEGLGTTNGYLLRCGTDHHVMALFPRRVRQALAQAHARSAANLARTPELENPEITINQLTFQVGSLKEVVDGHHYLTGRGYRLARAGRDPLGSNWHTYIYDPDGHNAELYYGIEQIGWDGRSKPEFKISARQIVVAPLPQASELTEVEQAIDRGVDIASGSRRVDRLPPKYEVDGVMLPRPFKIVRPSTCRIFVRDMAKSEAFYRDALGMLVSEEIVWRGHRCVFLRCNTEHHSLGLYPIELRDLLGLSAHTTCLSLGFQIATYRQLKDAVAFLKANGVGFVELPAEFHPGIDYTAYAVEPDGHLIELSYYMEQIGWEGTMRRPEQRRRVEPGAWPETLEPLSDSFMGEQLQGPLG
jgi:catechol 2,3-dioxygenase-like lactoylglutathione lyase family enzyme